MKADPARLIAEAPEMLEELKFLVDRCVETVALDYGGDTRKEIEVLKAGNSTVRRIRELIRKIEGA